LSPGLIRDQDGVLDSTRVKGGCHGKGTIRAWTISSNSRMSGYACLDLPMS